MSAGTEFGACTLSRSEVLHAASSVATPIVVASRRFKVVYGIGVMDVFVRRGAVAGLVAESDADHDRRELGEFRLIRADAVAQPPRVGKTVLRIEAGISRPRREVATAHRDGERLGADIPNRAHGRVVGERDLAQLDEVCRTNPVILQLTTIL